jgi:hypothetical protein
MGLTKSKSKIQKKFSADELSIFKKFLNENWQGKTPEDLMEIWNSKNLFKASRSKLLYHLKAIGCKISCVEVARIKHLRKKEEEVKQQSHKSQKELDERVRLLRINLMRNRFFAGKDIWTGLPSKEIELELHNVSCV